jgi:hypothetical protein
MFGLIMSVRQAAVVLALVTSALLVGCGGGSSGGSRGSPESFVQGLLTDVARGDYRKYYDAMYPAQQKLASYDYRCLREALLLAKGLGFDLSSLRVSRALIRPGTHSVEVPGTGETCPSRDGRRVRVRLGSRNRPAPRSRPKADAIARTSPQLHPNPRRAAELGTGPSITKALKADFQTRPPACGVRSWRPRRGINRRWLGWRPRR